MSSLSLSNRNYNRHDAKTPNSAAQGVRLPPSSAGGHSESVPERGGLTPVSGKSKQDVTGESRKLTKLLINVNIQRSFGPLQVFMSPENTVREVVKAAVETYVKEKRRPLLTEMDHRRYELHYSQFSLESLKAEEKLMNLGSRNFFVCPKPKIANVANPSLCFFDEVNAEPNCLFPLTKFMEILL